LYFRSDHNTTIVKTTVQASFIVYEQRFPSLAYSSTLKMEQPCLSNTECHTADDVNLITYLLTYSMGQGNSWEGNWLSAQDIPWILWNSKVHYRIHRCPPPVLILSQIYPVIPCFEIYFIFKFVCVCVCLYTIPQKEWKVNSNYQLISLL
jgi:hypothetical protein